MNLSLGLGRQASADPPFFIQRAEGVHVWDRQGLRYVDLTSGWNVVNAGWNNPEIMEAWRRCAATLPFRPSWCADEYSHALGDLLSDFWPGYIAIPGCSGAEAIDNALKVARLVTGRAGVMSFAGAYHGSSTGAAFATGYEVAHLEPLNWASKLVALPIPATGNGFHAAESAIRSAQDIGAIVVETIITNAGCREPSQEYLSVLRGLSDELGIIFICDEIGTGFGRTGAMLSHLPDLRPDVVVLGKALTNGLYPLSLTLVSRSLVGYLEWECFASTFAGAPLGCAAAVASMTFHARHNSAARAASSGAAMRERLTNNFSTSELVTGIHGRGLELAVHFDWSRCHEVGLTPHDLLSLLRKRRLFATLSSHDAELMIMPPLIANVDDLLTAADEISDVVATFN